MASLISHGPTAKALTEEQAAKSVVVTNIPPDTEVETIIIYFQRQKNGGGEVNHIHIPEEGTAVITFDSSEVATRVLEFPHTLAGSALKLQPLIPEKLPEVFQKVEARIKVDMFHMSPKEYQSILEVVKENTSVACKGSKYHILTGTFSQIKTAHKLLQHLVKVKGGSEAVHYDDGNEVLSQEESVVPELGQLAGESSSIAEPGRFDVPVQFMKLLKQMYRHKLQHIEETFGVDIVWEENASQVRIQPRQIARGKTLYEDGCNAFIDLYQEFHPNITREVIKLPDEANESLIQDVIISLQTEYPAIVENMDNSLVVYAKKDGITSSVRALKKKLSLKQNSGSQKLKRVEGNKGRDASEYSEVPQQVHFPFSPQHSNQVLKNGVNLSLYQGDITDEQVDAIVNAANEWLRHGAGVAAAIVRKGGQTIQDESDWLINKDGPLAVGAATFTGSGSLPCRHVIHAVGPRWKEHGREKSTALLRQACLESLDIAQQLNLSSIAFTAISSGIFGMPKEICAQIMFGAAEEFSASPDAEFTTLRDVRFVIIDQQTVSVFHEEFVKRYSSQVDLPETLTRGPPDVEEETSSTAEPKNNLMKRSGEDSVESEDQTNDKDIPPFKKQSKHDGSFESPRGQTGQDEESKNQRGMTDGEWHESPSSQGTEIAKGASLPFSGKKLEGEGTSEAVTDKDPARTRAPDSDNKRATTRPSGRGRGNLAAKFPGKENSSPPEWISLQNQSTHTVGGRGIMSDIPTSASSPPGLIVTEEGKFLAKHLSSGVEDNQETVVGAVKNNGQTGKIDSKDFSIKEDTCEQESELATENIDRENQDIKSTRGTPAERETSDNLQFDNDNTSTRRLLPKDKISENSESVIRESVEGCAVDKDTKESTVETGHVKANDEEPTQYQETIVKKVMEVPSPKTDPTNEGAVTSNDPSASQIAEKGLTVQKEPVKSAPHLSSDFQTSPPSIDEITEDPVNGREARLIQGSGSGTSGPSTMKNTYRTGQTGTPDCLMCMNLSNDPVPQGNQPIGYMSWTTEKQCSLPGYQDCGIIVVHFNFEKGVQGPEHPNPGQPYNGLFAKAFLPCNPVGQEVCRLLKTAFDARLVFKIGSSPAPGENVIELNGIELKACKSGGPANYGYPDPSYLDRVRSQLAEKGIK